MGDEKNVLLYLTTAIYQSKQNSIDSSILGNCAEFFKFYNFSQCLDFKKKRINRLRQNTSLKMT